MVIFAAWITINLLCLTLGNLVINAIFIVARAAIEVMDPIQEALDCHKGTVFLVTVFLLRANPCCVF